jgi:beta-fructofuranosidase
MNSVEFERRLFALRIDHYRNRTVSLEEGFRPVSGKVGDFCVVQQDGAYHIFAIERRLQESTAFFPGNEIYFCHASTEDFTNWRVHNPVLLIRPGTWEGAHVFAPFVIRWQGRFVMAYTGVNEFCSQDIGIAFSEDLLNWERSANNPISPATDRSWSSWRPDLTSSCRDPHLLIERERLYMTYTTNTAEGASCVALASTDDLKTWTDHGPILVGAKDGYEAGLFVPHVQGQLESSNLLKRNGRWYLFVAEKRRDRDGRDWIYESDRMDQFTYSEGREFWIDPMPPHTVETIKDCGAKTLLAGFSGTIRLGVVDWSESQPTGRLIVDDCELAEWLQ